MVPNGKPAPDLFLHAADTLGVAPGASLVIEDSPSGVAAALAAGMSVVGFVAGGHARLSLGRRLTEAGAPLVVDRAELLPPPL
jgi:beta-phosphoglucomutase-like phosphatase (HAD superfamily)